jgi:hypothetical protein
MDPTREQPAPDGADGSASASDAAAEPATSPQPLAEAPKGGIGDGLGSIIGAVIRGLEPVVRRSSRRTTHRTKTTTRRRSSSTSTRSSGSSGPLLSVHYHDGGSDWATTRVAFGRQGNRIAVISSADADWWRHIRTGSPVQVKIRSKWVDGTARLLAHDDPTYTRAVGVFIDDRSRAAAQRLGVPMDDSGRLDHGPRQSGDAAVIWIEVDGD